MILASKIILISCASLLGQVFVVEASQITKREPLNAPFPAIEQSSRRQFRLHGLNRFTAEQKDLLRQWLVASVNATQQTLGHYPRRLELYVYPRPSNQPVPWAHTRRDEQESIHFYVDTQFSLQEFVEDWTVYHELAHLAIPYVGESYAWFSEGFASFMQYQIMAHNNLLSTPLSQVYFNKIRPHLKLFDVEVDAATVARKLMEQRNYPAAYWGGAWYFLLAEQQLFTKHHIHLTDLISRYQRGNRVKDNHIQALVSSLDFLIDDSLFSDLLYRFEHTPAKDLYPKNLE